MSMQSVVISLYIVCVTSSIVFFIAALTLSFKSKVLSVKELAKTFRNPIPPRTMLNKFGKQAHTVLCISGVLASACILFLIVIEFTYGGTCLCFLTKCK